MDASEIFPTEFSRHNGMMQLLLKHFFRYLSPFLEYFTNKKILNFLQTVIPSPETELWQENKLELYCG